MSIRFNAATDRILRTSSIPSFDADYGFDLWFYIVNELADGGYGTLFHIDRGAIASQPNDWWGIQRSGATTRLAISTSANSGASYAETFGTAALASGQWYKCSGHRTGNASRLAYLDGALEVTHTASYSGRLAPTRMECGGASGNIRAIDGRIANVIVWAGSAPDTSDFQRPRGMPSRLTDLHLWTPNWVGVRLQDMSGNARDWISSGTLNDEDDPPVMWGRGPMLTQYAMAITDVRGFAGGASALFTRDGGASAALLGGGEGLTSTGGGETDRALTGGGTGGE